MKRHIETKLKIRQNEARLIERLEKNRKCDSRVNLRTMPEMNKAGDELKEIASLGLM
jgi:hypothetical protein